MRRLVERGVNTSFNVSTIRCHHASAFVLAVREEEEANDLLVRETVLYILLCRLSGSSATTKNYQSGLRRDDAYLSHKS